jgi:phosphoribosylglycinamide formyltransferase-1
MNNLAIFASGSGTNAENIIQSFLNEPRINISCVCTNKADAYVVERAGKYNVPVLVFNRDDFYHQNTVIEYLKDKEIDWIILAGFLWLVPSSIIQQYHGKIINIHPALLPKFGGKGMYGHHVHKAVIEAREALSGISIHYVDNEYDRGAIIFQATCPVNPEDTPETLAAKIHNLEYQFFPKVIREAILKQT